MFAQYSPTPHTIPTIARQRRRTIAVTQEGKLARGTETFALESDLLFVLSKMGNFRCSLSPMCFQKVSRQRQGIKFPWLRPEDILRKTPPKKVNLTVHLQNQSTLNQLS